MTVTLVPSKDTGATDATDARVATLPAPVEPADTDAVFAEVAREISELQRQKGLELTVEIGKLMVNRFFLGDLEAVRGRGLKTNSLRRLAEFPDFPLSLSALSRAIRIYELSERLGGIQELSHLTKSHLQAVLPLPEEKQVKLLKQAEDEAWSVMRLEEAGKSVRRESVRSGRPALPRFQKTIHALSKIVNDDESSFGDLERLDTLKAAEIQRLHETVSALLQRCAELKDALQGRLAGV